MWWCLCSCYYGQKNNIQVQVIKSKIFINECHYNLNEINQIHKEIHSDKRCRIGVSTCHLQRYLDMFCFKNIKYTTQYYDKERKILDKSIKSNIISTNKDIIKAGVLILMILSFRFYQSIS